MQSAGADEWDAGARVLDLAHHLIVPVLALGLPLAASFERIQQAAAAEGAAARHALAASARGVGLGRWLWRALWRPTASPVVSVFGLAAGTLLSGRARRGARHGVARARPADVRGAGDARHAARRRLRRGRGGVPGAVDHARRRAAWWLESAARARRRP